jgi:hypothetical protein
MPAPIIRAPRIPLELQRVFLAFNRGETVTEPPKNAFKVFPRNKSSSVHMRKVKSCEDFFDLCSSSFSSDSDFAFDESSVDEERCPRRGKRQLSFAAGDTLVEFDKRKPTNQCYHLSPIMSAKAVSFVKFDTYESPDQENRYNTGLLELNLPIVIDVASRWQATFDTSKLCDSMPSPPKRRNSLHGGSMDCTPSFPVRRNSGSQSNTTLQATCTNDAYPRRTFIDCMPRQPRRPEAGICSAA